jgi:inorganic pyrophosphatase
MTDPLSHTEIEFWMALDQLVAECEIVIDRPRHSAHAHDGEVIYPLDYGYLKGTSSADGGGIDLFMGTSASYEVALNVTAMICTVDPGKRDSEIKLLIECSDTEIEQIHQFFGQALNLPHLVIKRTPIPTSSV